MPESKKTHDLFERFDAGYCYIRVRRRTDHFEILIWPHLVTNLDMLELLAWATGSAVAAEEAEQMPAAESIE